MALGVAILGTGEMGLKYAEALARYTTGTRFVGVALGSRAAGMAARYDVPTATADEILSSDDVDAVVIATPHSTHVPLAVAAAAAGKHIYIEKPLARTAAECDEILAACERAGVRLAVNAVTRFRPSPIAAKRLLDDGAIGALRMIRVLSSAVGYEPSYKSWTSDPAGRRNLAGLGLPWLRCPALAHGLGRDRGVRVRDRLLRAAGPRPERDGPVQVQEWRRGAAPHVVRDATARARLGQPVDADRHHRDHRARWVQHGQAGWADGWKVVANQLPFDFDREPLAPHLIAGFATQLQDFVDAIAQNRDPIVTGRDGRASVEMVEAARRSSRERRSLSLPLNRP